ncbi:peptide ABC transporter permease [Acinetobacter sp. ANC 4204]|uniref:agmatine deiminase family protein n=1 Tax=Acinetobacter sp. ANC 4204 TaxID=1977884 RepID=UPI000A3456D9|nr:agmatine deiminase family protein [Acinetobacter sp. ANC 4204]OTG61444.1 peptide ABC transporter permease [Acinetobacter sp. ANC 4204]
MKSLALKISMAVLSMIPLVAKAELIVLASPQSNDAYYAKMIDDIFDFHVDYAKKIIKNGDNVVVLTDKQLYPDYVKALGKKHVAIAPMHDIWMRDFTSANPAQPVMFRYTAAGQGGAKKGQAISDEVQDEFKYYSQKAGLQFTQTKLLNDGGNWVEDGYGNVVLSTKFLADNKLTENEARKKLMALTGAKQIAFIEADEQGGLEHADGVVSFVDQNTLVINSYPEDPDYAKQLKADLKRGIPNVKIREIITPYDGSEIYDEKFGSACGLYTNMLATPERIYFPQFGIKEDAIALKQIRSVTKRTVIPVQSANVCHMGGGVRCMSWQVRGKNAELFLNYLNKISK